MAQRILYVNPIKKKSKRSLTKKGTKTVAKRKKVGKRKSSIRRRKNPIATVSANPIKRRKRRSVKRKNPIFKRKRASYISGATRREGIVDKYLKPAALAATGGVVMDIAWNNLPIPATAKQGAVQYVAKAIGAIGMVEIAKRVTTKQNAERMGIGALTILMHDIGRMGMRKVAPTLKMGEYVDGLGEYVDGLDEYVGAGGGLDFDAPLGFYETAGQGANTVPNYALPNNTQRAPQQDVQVPDHVAGSMGDMDAYDDYDDSDYLY